MRVTHLIATQLEGTLDEMLDGALEGVPPPPAPPSLEEVTKVLGDLCFLVETIAHLQGRETAMLPTAELGRDIIKRLQPVELVQG